MEKELREEFRDAHAKYVNATITHMEIVGTRDSINFEEESEWVANWWLSKLSLQKQKIIEKIEGKKKSMRTFNNGHYVGESKDEYYNQALEDIIKEIQ